jgi:hypothetical protein
MPSVINCFKKAKILQDIKLKIYCDFDLESKTSLDVERTEDEKISFCDP